MPTEPGSAQRERGRLPVALVLVGTVAALALLAAAVRPAWVLENRGLVKASRPTPTAPPALPSPVEQSPFRPPPATGDPLDLSWLPWVLLALVLAPIVVVLVRRLLAALRDVAERRADRSVLADVELAPELPVLQRGAEAAEARLAELGVSGDAIIAAWLELEEAARDAGTPRTVAQTPTEFTAAVLQSTGVDPEPVQTLLRLYLRARFGPARPRESLTEDVAEARRCIRALSDDWARRAAGLEPDNTR